MKTKTPLILFFCENKRQSIYEPIIKCLDHEVQFIEKLEELIIKCIETPPLVVMLDIHTCMLIGERSVAPLDNLRINLPILKCNINLDGEAIVTCQAIDKQMFLKDAINSIVSGDPSWNVPESPRRHIRLSIEARIKITKTNGKILQGNIQDVSCSGLCIITYGHLEKGEEIQLEIMDVQKSPILIKGKVVWTRHWEDNPRFPGGGIEIEEENVHKIIQSTLLKFESLDGYYRAIQ